MFAEFVSLVASTIESHASLEKLSRKQQKLLAKSWITPGILISIHHKRKLYEMQLLHIIESEVHFYKKYLNVLTEVKAAFKKAYYQNEFGRNMHDPRKTWVLINSSLSRNQLRKANSKVDQLKLDDQETTDSFIIAKKFNLHFASIGNNLADKIYNNDNNMFAKYLGQRVASSIYLEPPKLNEVYNLIHSLGLCKSSEHDQIDSYFIRIACDVITPCLTYLSQLSFELGIFQDLS